MARKLCQQCERAIPNCICQFITKITNQVNVVVLQHPSEVKQNKASLPILSASLSACQVFIGEDFSAHQALNQLLQQYQNRTYLLYPSDDAVTLISSNSVNSNEDICLILLDGTWKKAYKIFQLSKNLHTLPLLSLPQDLKGQYAIRKTQKAHALSTLEACCYALGILENRSQAYQVLVDRFVNFNQQQLAFVPKQHRRKEI